MTEHLVDRFDREMADNDYDFCGACQALFGGCDANGQCTQQEDDDQMSEYVS